MRGVWVAGAILIACSAFGDSQNNHQGGTDKSSNHGAGQQQNAQVTTPRVDVTISGHVDVKTDYKKDSSEESSESLWERPSTTNWLLVLFTLCLVFVGGYQGNKIAEQAALMNSTLKQTEITAKAAADSVELSRRKQRAYVFAESVSNNAEDWNSRNEFFEWTYKIVNYGETPAVIKEIKYLVAVTDVIPNIDGDRQAGNPRHPIDNAFEDEKISPEIILIASREREFTAKGRPTANCGPLIPAAEMGPHKPEVRMTSTQIFRLETGRPFMPNGIMDNQSVRLWIIGKVFYEDVFGERHETRFCFRGNRTNAPNPADRVQIAGGDEYNKRT